MRSRHEPVRRRGCRPTTRPCRFFQVQSAPSTLGVRGRSRSRGLLSGVFGRVAGGMLGGRFAYGAQAVLTRVQCWAFLAESAEKRAFFRVPVREQFYYSTHNLKKTAEPCTPSGGPAHDGYRSGIQPHFLGYFRVNPTGVPAGSAQGAAALGDLAASGQATFVLGTALFPRVPGWRPWDPVTTQIVWCAALAGPCPGAPGPALERKRWKESADGDDKRPGPKARSAEGPNLHPPW